MGNLKRNDTPELGFPGGSMVKSPRANAGDRRCTFLAWKDPLEEEMANKLIYKREGDSQT